MHVLVSKLNDNISDGGCGLKELGASIEDHFKSEKTKDTKLSERLIGEQAIKLAKYGLRLVDALNTSTEFEESEILYFYRCALSKTFETLRNIGTLINKVEVNNAYVEDVSKKCTLYFNLIALYFPTHSNSTVWTMGYVVPYHAKKLYDEYKIGYGILSMQGKESKNSAIKQELKSCSNRATTGEKNKWYQIMRSGYVRNFYLPYHYPMNTYRPHYNSRLPNIASDEICCKYCFRPINAQSVCDICISAAEFIDDAIKGNIPEFIQILNKPICCDICGVRFADQGMADKHTCGVSRIIVPKNMTTKELKDELARYKLSTVGSKSVLAKRLEDHIL